MQKDKERKRALSKKGGEGEIKKYFNEWEENRRRMEKIRSNLSQEEKDLEKEKLRERVAKLRLKQSPEEKNIIISEKNKEQERQEKVGMQKSIGLPSRKQRQE